MRVWKVEVNSGFVESRYYGCKNIQKASELMDIDFVASIVINKDGHSVYDATAE